MLNRKIFQYSRRFYHIYKKSYTPSSEFAEQNVIYYENGILVLNKPYGISFSQSSTQRKDNDRLEVSLSTILPFLKKKFGFTNIFNVRVPEKYNSGVAVFCTEESSQKKLHNYLLRMRRDSEPSDRYEAVVVGKPVKFNSRFVGAIKLENSPISAKAKRVELVSDWSKNELKKGLVKKVIISHRTLACSEDACLIEVSTSRNSWHCIRAYLSTVLLTPILGDNLYGSCVKTVFGTPILVDKFSQVASLPQKLPKNLINTLKLTSINDVAVPLQLHLSEVKINCFDKQGKYLRFIAPVPETFSWTCDVLGLTSSQEKNEICTNSN